MKKSTTKADSTKKVAPTPTKKVVTKKPVPAMKKGGSMKNKSC